MSDIDEPYNEDENYDDEEQYPAGFSYGGFSYPFDSLDKKYFTFDEKAWDAWGKWLYEAMKDVVESSPNMWYISTNIDGFPVKKFPVNDSLSNSTANSKMLYYGQNHYDEAIWKYKYFVQKDIDIAYKNHIIANAKHTVSQPNYYRNMFEILN